ncbi:hypothetical protein GGR56DRAFT_58671 [Xylariaceae sp. FL0804]|nr:hypothetical protein GGR56DRAFT_58671 [Xylariaceae sp. FL0804]
MTSLKDSQGAVGGESAPRSYVSEFHGQLDYLPKPISDILTSYSHIPKKTQLEHVQKLRDEAYCRVPYPCIGNFRFLDLDLAAHPAYQDHVLAPLAAAPAAAAAAAAAAPEPLFLDLGTCFGQDLRKLVYDGARPGRLWASDLRPELIDLGFRLFDDGDDGRLPRRHFLCPGDILAAADEDDDPAADADQLRLLDGRVTILHVTAVFHLFDLAQQVLAADRCLRLLRKDTAAPVLVVGCQAGSARPGSYLRRNANQEHAHKYRHNGETWRQLWEEVCGGPEWRDKIKKVEVNSKLLKRVRNDSADTDEVITFAPPGPDDLMLWHIFEVWVTFA